MMQGNENPRDAQCRLQQRLRGLQISLETEF